MGGCWRGSVGGRLKRAARQAAYDRAKGVLKTHEAELHLLAKQLLQEETLSGQQIKELVEAHKGGGRSKAL